MGGGLRKHVVQLIQHLDKDKYEIYLIHGTETVDSVFLEEYRILKTKAHIIPCNTFTRDINIKNDFKTFLFISEMIKKIQPDIVHCHSSKAGAVGRMAAKRRQVKKVFYTPHAYSFMAPEFGKFKKKLFIEIEKNLTKYATTEVFCVSKGEMMRAVNANVAKTKKITVVYNGLPEIIFPPKGELKKKLGFSEENIIVGNNARMSEQKNPVLFFEIAQKVISKNDNIHFVWIGEGPLLGPMKKLRNNSPFKKNIHFLGNRNDCETLVSGFDIYLTTSLYEGLPYALIEALRAGIKIIGTNVVGNQELISDDSLFNLNDVNTAVLLLMKNINKYDRDSLDRKKFEDSFTLNRMIERIDYEYCK